MALLSKVFFYLSMLKVFKKLPSSLFLTSDCAPIYIEDMEFR